ncbi:MAG: hypothetical protein JO030_06360, partial [Candidatus Eremiobacteraeota bacterium]|nr:hypothetical protein [Candidatus Eremiobacteraeota bacterium]
MNGATWLLTAALVAQANVASGAGDAAFARGDFDAAFRAYSAAVAASPRDFDALLGLGTMDLYRGDLAQAHLYLTEALQVNPSDAVAQRRLHALRALEGPPGDFDVSMSAREVDVPFV